MKTIEQKAKAYDKALEIAKPYYEEAIKSEKTASVEFLESMFDELGDNDEKIRKEIIEYIKIGTYHKDWLAWLEKQGEQKSVEWSKEDEGVLSDAEGWLDTLCDYLKDSSSECIPHVKNVINRLNTIKNRIVPQPKQAWSEEDHQYLLVCKNALRKYQASDKWDAGIISRWLENKLKAPQNTWKPSDEQMEVLDEVLNFAANHESPYWNDYIFGTLNNLIRQLKKLKA